jgi:hypothetical protein
MKVIIQNIYDALVGISLIMAVVSFLLAFNHGIDGNGSSLIWCIAGFMFLSNWIIGVIALRREIKRLEKEISGIIKEINEDSERNRNLS